MGDALQRSKTHRHAINEGPARLPLVNQLAAGLEAPPSLCSDIGWFGSWPVMQKRNGYRDLYNNSLPAMCFAAPCDLLCDISIIMYRGFG